MGNIDSQHPHVSHTHHITFGHGCPPTLPSSLIHESFSRGATRSGSVAVKLGDSTALITSTSVTNVKQTQLYCASILT